MNISELSRSFRCAPVRPSRGSKRVCRQRSHCATFRPQPVRSSAIHQLNQASKGSGILKFIDDQFLPLGLVTALLAGYAFPAAALAAGEADAASIATTAIFILSGLQMRRGEAKQAMKHKSIILLGLGAILFATPLVARLVLSAPIVPAEFAYGLAVFCCMPTSLSANIALSGAVGANTAISILLTASSNMLAVATVPFVIASLLSSSSAIVFDPVVMSAKLAQTVLLPLVIGASLRTMAGVRRVIDNNKKVVRNLGTVCLAAVPFTQIGSAKASGLMAQLTPGMIGALMLAVLAALIIIRACNVHFFPVMGRVLGDPGEATPDSVVRAVVLAANQKTLPISIAVLLQLTDVIGPGVALATLACVVAHFTQVLLDSVLVGRWKAQDAAAAAA